MTRKKGDLVWVWTVYTATLEAENEALKKVVQELHDEIVAQDKEYKSLGNMNLKLLEENRSLKDDIVSKDKLLMIYDKENKILKMSLEEKDENCYALARENAELKKELYDITRLDKYK